MFRDKYVYTCPDIIHLRERNKKCTRAVLIGYGAFLSALWVVGTAWEKAEIRRFNETKNNPEEN